MSSPFATLEADERRLRFDVLALAHRVLETGGYDLDADAVCNTARTLMDFIDNSQTAGV